MARSGSARATRTRTTATRPSTMAAVAPLLLASIDPIDADLRGSLDDVRAALEDAEGLMAAAIAHHGATKCAIDIALHDLAGKRLGLPVRALLGRGRRAAPDRLHARPRRARGRRGTGAPGRRLPGAQDQGGRRRRHRDARGRPSGVRGPDPRRREHRLDARRRARAAARARAAGRGAHRAAVPGPPPRPAALAPGAHPRCRIVADESAVTIEDLDALVGRDRRRQREAREVRRAWGRRGGCSSGPGRSGSGRSSAAWRRRRSGSPRRPRSRRSRSGSTSTAACCSPTTR